MKQLDPYCFYNFLSYFTNNASFKMIYHILFSDFRMDNIQIIQN